MAAALEALDETRGLVTARREESFHNLQAALLTKDPNTIKDALEAARNAGLGTCTETQLAEGIVAPAGLVRDGLQCEDLATTLLLPEEFRGFTAEAAAAAELEACKGKNREQLAERVVQLTRYLAMSRVHAKARLEDALTTRMEAADAANLQSLEQALARIGKERDQTAAKEFKEFEGSLQQQHEEIVARAKEQAMATCLSALASEEAKLQASADEAVLEQKGARVQEVVSLHEGLVQVEQALHQDEIVVQQVHACSRLCVAVLGLEDAILAGGNARADLDVLWAVASQSDPFVANVWRSLKEGCPGIENTAAVSAEPVLRDSFAGRLDDLVAAAFVPPGGGLIAEIVGRIFRSLYISSASAIPSKDPLLSWTTSQDQKPQASETWQNLALLSSCPTTAEGPEDLRGVLTCLEGSLKGTCHDRSEAWLQDLRQALLMWQAVRASKARAQCLSAALSATSA